LKHYREHVRDDQNVTPRRAVTQCPYDDCVPSHFLSTDSLIVGNVDVDDVKLQNEFLGNLGEISNLLYLYLNFHENFISVELFWVVHLLRN